MRASIPARFLGNARPTRSVIHCRPLSMTIRTVDARTPQRLRGVTRTAADPLSVEPHRTFGLRAYHAVVNASFSRTATLIALSWILNSAGLRSQEPQPEIHEHVAVTAPLLTPPRDASGTAWLPDATPMYGVHREWRGWELRVNGALFAQALLEPADRHRTGGAQTRQVTSTNWGMIMARRSVAGGRLGLRTMVSAEPWTVSRCGSLNFLAVGERCAGDTVHDRQQPHDLVMELAGDYERRLQGEWKWQLYAGIAGEPALGPVGYPHRTSAAGNPTAPLTHHWLDSTHVSFGVITAGVRNRRLKVESSVFNGREADESRVDLDLGSLDSASARVSFLPTERWALQISAARLRVATSDFPFKGQTANTRATASATYHRPFGANGIWATMGAYGVNHARERVALGVLDASSQAGLLETTATFSGRHSVFARVEYAGMPAHHLHAHEYSLSIVPVGKLQAGYVVHLKATKGLVPGIGGAMALNLLAPQLAPRYGGRTAWGTTLFLAIQTARHEM